MGLVVSSNKEIQLRIFTKAMARDLTIELRETDCQLEKEDTEVHSKTCEEGYHLTLV
jgi:hypothetical protein